MCNLFISGLSGYKVFNILFVTFSFSVAEINEHSIFKSELITKTNQNQNQKSKSKIKI